MNKGLNITNVLKTVNSAYERFDKDACLHSLQVAYLTLKICKNMDMDEDTKNSLVIAAYFHDFSAEKTNMCDSLDKYEKGNAVKEHCILGYLLFKFLLPKSDICKFILYHHNTYDVDYIINNIENPLESNIIKLADDISIYNIFNRQASVNDVIDFLNERSYMYNPNYLNRFLDTNAKMAIENVLNESYKENFWKEVDLLNYKVITIEDIIVCLAFIIDCKCDITNFHSLSVSNTSCMLGKYFNLSENEYYNLKIGSLLHDIGKIAIPNEILKKEMEVSIKAGEVVGLLYDALIKQYKDPENVKSLESLNMLCVRIVFCLYAEDSGIFGKHAKFHDYLKNLKVKDV